MNTTNDQNARAAQMAQGTTQYQLAQRVVQLEDELLKARSVWYTQQADIAEKEDKENAND